jgi:hypothetical protein
MWWKAYKDYPLHKPLKNQHVETGRGIIGCEMHDLNGWGEEYHESPREKPGLFVNICTFLFGTKVEND